MYSMHSVIRIYMYIALLFKRYVCYTELISLSCAIYRDRLVALLSYYYCSKHTKAKYVAMYMAINYNYIKL